MHPKSIQEKAERCGEEIDWETSFEMVHGQNKFQSFITSMADSHRRSHRVKALLGLLPTAEVLHRRLPDTYKFEKCPVCRSDNETHDHIWECSRTKEIRESVIAEAAALWTEKTGRTTEYQISEDLTLLASELFERTPNSMLISKVPETWIFQGYIPKIWTLATIWVTGSVTKAKKIIEALMDLITTRSQKEIWNPRCEHQIKWERTFRIGIKEKRKHKKREKQKKQGKG